LLGEQYDALRRTRGDGNCFYRSFMFSYLEHILETQDKAEVERILKKIEQCKKTLADLGYIEFTFEDFFSVSLYCYFVWPSLLILFNCCFATYARCIPSE
jgi:ubiquitin thioesterase protein OTUB1